MKAAAGVSARRPRGNGQVPMGKNTKKGDERKAPTIVDEQLAELRVAWATHELPPLDGEMSDEQALTGLGRIEAWVRWARAELQSEAEGRLQRLPEADRSDGAASIEADRALIRRRVAALNATLNNMRPPGSSGRGFDADLRWSIVEAILVAAAHYWSSEGDEDAVAHAASAGVTYARTFAPSLADRLDSQRDQVKKAIAAFRNGQRALAARDLNAILGAYDASKKPAPSAAWKDFNDWRDARRKRLQPDSAGAGDLRYDPSRFTG